MHRAEILFIMCLIITFCTLLQAMDTSKCSQQEIYTSSEKMKQLGLCSINALEKIMKNNPQSFKAARTCVCAIYMYDDVRYLRSEKSDLLNLAIELDNYDMLKLLLNNWGHLAVVKAKWASELDFYPVFTHLISYANTLKNAEHLAALLFEHGAKISKYEVALCRERSDKLCQEIVRMWENGENITEQEQEIRKQNNDWNELVKE